MDLYKFKKKNNKIKLQEKKKYNYTQKKNKELMLSEARGEDPSNNCSH